MHRPTLGALAAVLLVAGLVVTYATDSEIWASILVRGGAVLGAIWLVLPSARQIPRPVWFGIGVFVVIVAVRPRLVLWALLAAAVVMLLTLMVRGRTKVPEER